MIFLLQRLRHSKGRAVYRSHEPTDRVLSQVGVVPASCSVSGSRQSGSSTSNRLQIDVRVYLYCKYSPDLAHTSAPVTIRSIGPLRAPTLSIGDRLKSRDASHGRRRSTDCAARPDASQLGQWQARPGRLVYASFARRQPRRQIKLEAAADDNKRGGEHQDGGLCQRGQRTMRP